jgi:hypothetical protein
MMLDTASLISAAMLLGLIVAVWRGGAANPVGTRTILDKIGGHDARLRKVETRIEDTATNAAIGVLTVQLRALEAHAASSGEVIEIQGDVKALRATVAAIEKAADRTEAGVQRIEALFIKRGIDQ